MLSTPTLTPSQQIPLFRSIPLKPYNAGPTSFFPSTTTHQLFFPFTPPLKTLVHFLTSKCTHTATHRTRDKTSDGQFSFLSRNHFLRVLTHQKRGERYIYLFLPPFPFIYSRLRDSMDFYHVVIRALRNGRGNVNKYWCCGYRTVFYSRMPPFLGMALRRSVENSFVSLQAGSHKSKCR